MNPSYFPSYDLISETYDKVEEIFGKETSDNFESSKKIIDIRMKRYSLDDHLNLYYPLHQDVDDVNNEKYIEKYVEMFHLFNNEFSMLNRIFNVPFYQSFGDIIGYINGKREFNDNDPFASSDFINNIIIDYVKEGGISGMNFKNLKVSDDTILYLKTMRCVIATCETKDVNDFGKLLKKEYLKSESDLSNRHPGVVTMESLEKLKTIDWDKIPYNSTDIGNGASMRSGSIGLFFFMKDELETLVNYSIECSRITHNSAISILGSVASAYFTSLAIRREHPSKWIFKLAKLVKSNVIEKYIEKTRPDELKLYQKDKHLFEGKIQDYITKMFDNNKFKYHVKSMINPISRFKYLSDNFSKGCNIPGACGDDSIIFAYDAVMRSNGNLEKIILYSALHIGDSDTVGSISLSWFAAYYHNNDLEFALKEKFFDMEKYNNIKKEVVKSHRYFMNKVMIDLRMYYYKNDR